MTPQSLRIGNYVRLRDTGEIVRVCGVTKRKIGFHTPDERPNAQLRYRKLSEIEGVPIRDVYEKLSGIVELEDGFSYEEYRYVHGSVCYDYICIAHLHELQNIHYALTGNEIEIEI